MKLPLIVLGLAAVGAGLLGHRIAELLGEHGEAIDPVTAVLSVGVAVVGIAAAWFAYRDAAVSESDRETRWPALWGTLRAAYGFDGFVMRFVVSPTAALCRGAYRFVDRAVIDWAAEGVGAAARKVGSWFAALQGGDVQWYAALLGAGTVLLMALAMMGWR